MSIVEMPREPDREFAIQVSEPTCYKVRVYALNRATVVVDQQMQVLSSNDHPNNCTPPAATSSPRMTNLRTFDRTPHALQEDVALYLLKAKVTK